MTFHCRTLNFQSSYPRDAFLCAQSQEVPGEDAGIVSDYGAAFIAGLQGVDGADPRYLLAAAVGASASERRAPAAGLDHTEGAGQEPAD